MVISRVARLVRTQRTRPPVKVMAILAVYNEQRFLATCLEHLGREGVQAYVIDNGSTDATPDIVGAFEPSVVVGREVFPRDGVYRWEALLRRKEELALELDAEWFMHLDADELRSAPPALGSLAEAFAAVDAAGYNAVDFMEFTFVPTREHPDHDHPEFAATMKWYYPFRPFERHQVKAWKRQDERVDLASGGGHRIEFPGVRIYPEAFPMRHYLYLSRAHVVEKYVQRTFAEEEVARGWHGARARITREDVTFPSENDLRLFTTVAELDPSEPRRTHWLFEGV